MQLDTGAITINQENIHDILQRDADIIGHIHLSEPNLVPLGRGSANHVGISNALNSVLPHLIATIEMLETKSESSLVAIEEALNFVTRNYRHSAGEVV